MSGLNFISDSISKDCFSKSKCLTISERYLTQVFKLTDLELKRSIKFDSNNSNYILFKLLVYKVDNIF